MNHLELNKQMETSDVCFDIPLPPPPLELQDDYTAPISHENGSINTNQMLPPPPPLPSHLVNETDSVSSLTANSSSICNNVVNSKNGNESVKEERKVTRSYLDDINMRRYVLKPTSREQSALDDSKRSKQSNDDANNTIQPFVNNSDVAAIIDFIRKFRPHVCDSSDEEENSDWDE
jgi:hypothetical protein